MPKEGIVSVSLEPLPGKTDEEVLVALFECGAGSATILSPGFISAKVDRDSLPQLSQIARISEKPLKKPHW